MDRGTVAQTSDEDRPRRETSYARALVAETLGTALLTGMAAGVEVVALIHPGHTDRLMKAATSGLIVAAIIYALGDVSGAHLNPAVTTSFALRGSFPWLRVPGYVAAQLAGATVAALGVRWLIGTAGHGGSSTLHVSRPHGLAIEAVVTVVLILVIVNTASEHALIGTDAALAVGATITVCGLFAGELTSASMNPARSFGPAVASGHTADLWVFTAGPFVGVIAAYVLGILLRPRPTAGEVEAARGKS